MKTGFPCVEILHRENPVLAQYWPCKGLQCNKPPTKKNMLAKKIQSNLEMQFLWTNWHLPGICLSCDSQFSQYHCWCWLWLYWSNLWHIAQTRLRRPTQRCILSNSCPVKNAQARLRNREMDKTKMRFVRIFVQCSNTIVLYPVGINIHFIYGRPQRLSLKGVFWPENIL